MLLTIDLESDIPLYTQIRNEIVKGIATKDLVAGETLPSVRQLANDIGVNMHTINKAYNQLKQEGFLSVHRRKGVVVNSLEKYSANDAYYEKFYRNLEPLLIEALCRGVDADKVKTYIDQLKNEYLSKK